MWNGINLTLNFFNSPPSHPLPPSFFAKLRRNKLSLKSKKIFMETFDPLMRNVPRWSDIDLQLYLKRNSGAARFSKCVWSFWNFMHSRAKSLWHHCLGTVNWSEKKNWNQPLWNYLRKHWFHKLGFTKWDTTAHTCQVKVSTKYFCCPLWIILNRNE